MLVQLTRKCDSYCSHCMVDASENNNEFMDWSVFFELAHLHEQQVYPLLHQKAVHRLRHLLPLFSPSDSKVFRSISKLR